MSRDIRSVKQVTQTIQVDSSTGEVQKTTTDSTYKIPSEPPYIKLYLENILYLSDLPKSHEKVLSELLKQASYAGEDEGMTIAVSSGSKRILAKKLGIQNDRTINNILSELVKGHILERIETGYFRLNPWLFGKGDWKEIYKIRLEVNYSEIDGRTFKAYCKYKDANKDE